MSVLYRAFKTKSLRQLTIQQNSSPLEKTFGLFDLLCVGVGSTIGSGIFVLTGFIALKYSGPSIVFSWLLAGVACCFSAVSFAELSCKYPSAGSSYSFASVSLGEWPAYIAACCLSLECGVSSSAVARSWGFKLNNMLSGRSAATDSGINWYAAALELGCVLVFLRGVEAGKVTVNILTVGKIVLIIFIVIMGFSLFNADHFTVMMPMGVGGIVKGATFGFFGFVGYDEVCCMALEAKDPQRDIPRAVIGTVLISTLCYCIAAIALIGTVPYSDIDAESCFSAAFYNRGISWAGTVTAVGELVVLPLVVFVSFLAQPRILYSMAEDNLIPQLFKQLDANGNFFKGIVLSGSVCILIAALVPFDVLDELISAGVLVQFSLTNIALIVIRRGWLSRQTIDITVDISVEPTDGFGQSLQDLPIEECKNGSLDLTEISLSPLFENGFGSNHQSELKNEIIAGRSESSIGQEKRPQSCIYNYMCEKLLLVFVMCSVGFAFLANVLNVILESGGYNPAVYGTVVTLMVAVATAAVGIAFSIHYLCPEDSSSSSADVFRVPGVPFTPLFGVFVNIYLISQVSAAGLVRTMAMFCLASVTYVIYTSSTGCVQSHSPTSSLVEDGVHSAHAEFWSWCMQFLMYSRVVTYEGESVSPARNNDEGRDTHDVCGASSSSESFACVDISGTEQQQRQEMQRQPNVKVSQHAYTGLLQSDYSIIHEDNF